MSSSAQALDQALLRDALIWSAAGSKIMTGTSDLSKNTMVHCANSLALSQHPEP